MRAIALIALCAAAALLAARLQGGDGLAATGIPEIDTETRAATLSFAPDVKPADRAWILNAVATVRPEAQRLIAEVDGLIEIRTDLRHDEAVGLAQMRPGQSVVSFDVRPLNGERALDRNVVVLHELGHVIDYQLVSDELVQQLDRQIPRVGDCGSATLLHTGACTAVEERFADTFAKWALRGRISLASSGYGIPAPASNEDWGAPLGLLAAQLNAR